MAITIEQVDIWRASQSENQRLEFKEAKTQFDGQRLCEYCVALANEGGGFLLLGVADKPLPRPIVGTQAFPDPVAQAERLFHQLGFRVGIEVIPHPAGRIVAFRIPSRPRGTAYQRQVSHAFRRSKGSQGHGPTWVVTREVDGRTVTKTIHDVLSRSDPKPKNISASVNSAAS
ncbi:MAG: helix-turn-helix domain-containing protein [Bryobacteraceae bacterium]